MSHVMAGLLVNPEQSPSISLVEDYPKPTPNDNEVLLSVRTAGICSTDLEIAAGYMGFRGIPGHEFVADVVNTDPEDELHAARVVAEINCVCHQCDMCKQGLTTHCRNRTVVGILGRDGAFGEYLCVPRENVHRVPDRVPDHVAVFTEPVAAAIQIVRQVPIDDAMKVSVIGSGRLGLLIAQVIAAHGCEFQLIGRNPKTLALAEEWGLKSVQLPDVTAAGDQDVVVDATGSPAGLVLAQRLVRPRGTIVLKSTYAKPEPIDLAALVINEVRLLGNRCGPFPDALEWLEHGKLQVEPLITSRYPLTQGISAFEAASRPDEIKVLIEMQPTS